MVIVVGILFYFNFNVLFYFYLFAVFFICLYFALRCVVGCDFDATDLRLPCDVNALYGRVLNPKPLLSTTTGQKVVRKGGLGSKRDHRVHLNRKAVQKLCGCICLFFFILM